MNGPLLQMLQAVSSGEPLIFIAALLVALILLLICFPIHELAHAAVAYRLGDDTAQKLGRITLNPLAHLDPIGSVVFLLFGFGWAKPVPVNVYRLNGNTKVSHGLVALAGPLSNLALAAVFGLAFRALNATVLPALPFEVGRLAEAAAYLAIILNVYLALFNLIPVPPLDGSRVLAALLPDSAGPILEQLERYGIFILIVLFAFAPQLVEPVLIQPANRIASFLLGW
ncbi:MAG: site-2 protease family protein [Anaerolineae bacterium]|nr:site-2 protease family protein [Thermoflexales bacterium]MDW8406987.1 site-2 protease family protein [Anaerolineae bacterium]